jgi:hypothetical protein
MQEVRLGRAFVSFAAKIDDNPKEALTDLKHGLGLRGMMDGAIQALSRLYATYQNVMAAKEADPEKFNEMYNLEEQILKQIADLDASGQSEQAVTTYQQLVEIIRNTYGVDTLHM